MIETAQEALQFLREVRSVAFATVNNGSPAVRIADVMLVEGESLYFLTARGKPYYRELTESGRTAICGMNSSYVTVRVTGDIEVCTSEELLDKIFEHNPVLGTLYPGQKRKILEVFRLYRGRGEVFDLSSGPPKRARFAFGGAEVSPPGYSITDRCTACGVCSDACPVEVISEGDIYSIDGSRCLECGSCAEICPEEAIEPGEGL